MPRPASFHLAAHLVALCTVPAAGTAHHRLISRSQLPLCYAADAPWKMMLSEAEFGERVRLTEDICVVDGEAFFLRGHIEIPLHDTGKYTYLLTH